VNFSNGVGYAETSCISRSKLKVAAPSPKMYKLGWTKGIILKNRAYLGCNEKRVKKIRFLLRNLKLKSEFFYWTSCIFVCLTFQQQHFSKMRESRKWTFQQILLFWTMRVRSRVAATNRFCLCSKMFLSILISFLPGILLTYIILKMFIKIFQLFS
jgi:hypothetical protein